MKEKGKKSKNKEKEGEPVGEVVVVSGAASTSNGKKNMVMLVIKKELFMDHDEDTSMLLLAHCFNTNLSFISPLILLCFRIMKIFSQRTCSRVAPTSGY